MTTRSLLALAFFCRFISAGFSQSDPCAIMDQADSHYWNEDSTAAQLGFYLAFEAARNARNWDLSQEALYKYADITYDLKDYQGAIDTLERWTPFLEKQAGIDWFGHAKLYLARSFIEDKLNNNSGQLEALEKAIDIYLGLGIVHDNVAYAYKNAGQILVMRLNYPKAIAYYEKALEYDTAQRYTASVCSYISDLYYWLGDYDKGLHYFEKGLKVKALPKHQIMLAMSGAGNYLKKNDYAQAEKYARQALDILAKNLEENIEDGPLYATLAEILHAQNKLPEAIKNWNLALETTAREYPDKNREHAKMLANAGEFFSMNGQPEKALDLYQRAIVQCYPGFNSPDPEDNPSPDFNFVESWAMTAPARKAQLLMARYGKTADPKLLANAAQCYDLALRQVRLLKTTYGTDVAKLYMGEYSHGYFEEAIRVQSMLYAETQDRAHLERIYQLMEDSKADVLREAVDRGRALLSGSLPDSLLRKEESLRLYMAELRNQIAQEQLLESETDEASLQKYRTMLADQERAYEKVMEAIKVQDPRFQGPDREEPHTALKEIMRRLGAENGLMLEYFFGKEVVYLMGIHTGGAFLHTFPNDANLGAALQRYGGYFKDANASLSDPAGYFEAAHALFALLIPREAAALLDESGALLVIPDGPLGYLPFEALLTDSYTGKSFGQAPYLIKKRPVQYSWSAELLWRAAPERRGGAFVQFDPQFSKGERGLVPLVQGKKETAPLAKLQRLGGSAAVLAEFQRRAPTSLLLHLSTHASAEAGSEPRVEFFDQALTLPQLYALLLPTDLVVLSACETNLGEIAAGEGVMSLARGFAYAGASSLIATQWEVNESSTAQILAQFYKGLSNDQTKLAALGQAKLQYLENTPSAAQQSPYFWAGLSFYGQDGTLELPAPFPLWAWGLLLFFILLFGILLFRRFR